MKHFALAILVSIGCSEVNAQVVTLYQQNERNNLSNGSFWNSLVDPNGGGAEVGDRFTLSDASVISAIGWSGYFAIFSDSLPANNASAWNIRLYEDSSGIGSLIDLQTIADASVARNFRGNTTIFPNTLREEHFRFSSAITPLSLDAGDYWLSIQSVNILNTDFSPTSGSVFAWDPAVANAADNLSVQRGLPSGTFENRSGDRAFSVLGTISAVPEPGSAAFLAFVTLFAGFRRKTRSKCSKKPE